MNMIPKEYFAAASTSRGFDSNFGEVFAPKKFKTLYILKGGAGCGKSTIIKRIAKEAQSRGIDYELYYCSADTSSLDGIIIPPLGAAIVDGTAPHITEPSYPGAVEITVDLGAYFDTEKLSARRGEIIRLSDEYKKVRRRVDGWLKAAENAYSVCRMRAENIFDREKSRYAAKRSVSSLAREATPEYTRTYTSVLSAYGVHTLDTFLHSAEEITDVGNDLGLGRLFIGDVVSALRDGGISHTVCPCVIAPDLYESVYIPSAKRLIRLGDRTDDEKYVNPRRFITACGNDERTAIRSAVKITEKLCDCATGEMLTALSVHNALEAQYAPCIDFDGVNRITDGLIERIFGLKC